MVPAALRLRSAASSPDDAPQPVIRRPWVRHGEPSIGLTQIIFGINVAVFLGMVLASRTIMDFPGLELVHWGANIGALSRFRENGGGCSRMCLFTAD